jgi:hypothetical protein
VTLRLTRWIAGTLLISVASYYLVRFASQVWLDGGLIDSNSQLFSWRALFEFGAALGAFSAAAAAFLLFRSPLRWQHVVGGVMLLLAAPFFVTLPLVGHFAQVDPCLNLGKSHAGDSCSQ